MTAVLVFVGAMIGAPLRYLTDRAVQRRHDTPFPSGTFVVNIAGALLLGCLTGAGTALPGAMTALLGVGFCGALTTFSTFSYETLRLAEDGAYLYALGNVLATAAAGVGAAVLGEVVVDAFVP